jgi:hypothetical protein
MKNVFFKTLMLKGEAGNSIVNIAKTSSALDVDTYTITLSDGSTFEFDVTNGSSIESIEKTGTSGYVDTYTITLTNGDTTTFEVQNGEDGSGYEVPAGAVLYFDSSDPVPEGYEASSDPNLNDIVVESKSATFTPASTGSSNVTVNITKTGYTPIGIVGITGQNTSVMSYSDWYVDSNTTAKVYYRASSTSYEVTLTLRVLYKKA